MADVTITNQGSLMLFELNSPAARHWAEDNVDLPEYMRFGNGFVSEYRYAWDLAQGMIDSGLEVE